MSPAQHVKNVMHAFAGRTYTFSRIAAKNFTAKKFFYPAERNTLCNLSNFLYFSAKKNYKYPMKNTQNTPQHVHFDYSRKERLGLPEAIFCEGKDRSIILSLLQEFNKNTGKSILFTRLSPEIFYSFPSEVQEGVSYHTLSRTAFAFALPAHASKKKVAVVSAGSADAQTAWESSRTLEYLGIDHTMFEDCGVAGLWRIQKALPEIEEHDIVIAVAGLDAALISVLGGLTKKPLLAVPSSVGYGMAKHGETALSSMLVSCSSGISVFNIDNGFGAACAAARILNMFLS